MSRRMNVAEFVAKRLHGLTASPALPTAAATPIIGTHDGNFHCDEAMAVGLLRHTQQYANCPVVRTRVPDVLKQCNIVVDVGAEYLPLAGRLDHHQPEFQDTMDTGLAAYKTRLSSAGLVYRHFGREILKSYVDACVESGALPEPLTPALLDLLYDRVYKTFVEHVDGIDNGVEEFASATPGEALVRNYSIPTTLSARVSRLYPRWNDVSMRVDEDAAFAKAVALTTTEFFEAVDFLACAWIPARSSVSTAFDLAASVHPSQQIVSLDSPGAPWKEHLLDVEKERGCIGRTLYVLFGDAKGWRVQAVPKENSLFLNRKPLPWKGLRDEALSAASGIEGCVFVHASGFIGGNKTREGAMKMAVKALEMTE